MSSLFSIPGPVLSFSFMTLPLLITQYARFQRSADYAANVVTVNLLSDNRVFDFIVVGAGSAGAVVANRLSAPPYNYKVLLMEAGGDPSWIGYIPAADIFSTNNPETDWQYRSEPQRNCSLSMKNTETFLHRGKSLGGTSNVNFMIYLRGAQAGFDEWAELTGDPSWSAQGVLPYFKKSEKYIGNYPNPDVHGTDGPLYVDKSEYQPSIDLLLETLHQYGLNERDVNDNQTDSWMKIDTTTNGGVRWSTYSAFIRPILNRKNLVVCRYCFVHKLLFAGDGNSVVGVSYTRHNTSILRNVYASKEVILSAGAFNSPKILMLSGIGPGDHLASLGIPVRLHNPNVGSNLYDHTTTAIPILFNTTDTSFLPERDIAGETIEAYDNFKSGPLSANNIHSTGFTSSDLNDDPNFPDLQFFILYPGISHTVDVAFTRMYNFRKRTFEKYLSPYTGRDAHFMLVSQVRPKSVGSVRLASRNPHRPPKIDLNYFSDPEDYDIKSLIYGVRYGVDFFENSEAYRRIGAKLPRNKYPGCEKFELRTDDYYECYIRHFTGTLWHFSSTCRMGTGIDDPDAVVDPQLRVIGINRLRVIDASVMPKVTNGNTNAPSIMIGEKGADMILKAWGNRESVATSTEEGLFDLPIKFPKPSRFPKLPIDFEDILGIGLGINRPSSRVGANKTPATNNGKFTNDVNGDPEEEDDEPVDGISEDDDGDDVEEEFPVCFGGRCETKVKDSTDYDYGEDEDREELTTQAPGKQGKNKFPNKFQIETFPAPFPPTIHEIPHDIPFISKLPPYSPHGEFHPFPEDFHRPHHHHPHHSHHHPHHDYSSGWGWEKPSKYFTHTIYWPPKARRIFKEYEDPDYFSDPPFHIPVSYRPGCKKGKKCFPQQQRQTIRIENDFCQNLHPLPPWERFYLCPTF